ncbi:MAG: NotI family restriction endonuclease [bacterium]
MARLRLAEVFGRRVENRSAEAAETRRRKWCPFQNRPCTKDNARDPLGVCSLSGEGGLVITCPYRFLEGHVIFRDAAAFAFGPTRASP